MANAIEKELLIYFMQLNETEKKSVLQMLKTFAQERKNNLNEIDIERYNEEIDRALAEVAEGKYITQQEMEKKASKW